MALTGAQVIGFESTRMRMNWYSRIIFDGDRLSSDKTVAADSSNTEVTVADVQGLRNRLVGPFITITDGSRGV